MANKIVLADWRDKYKCRQTRSRKEYTGDWGSGSSTFQVDDVERSVGKGKSEVEGDRETARKSAKASPTVPSFVEQRNELPVAVDVIDLALEVGTLDLDVEVSVALSIDASVAIGAP